MYKIIGADQKEYGPVDADQIRRWITERRANSQSLVKPDGGPWKPLGELPEFRKDLGIEPTPAAPKPVPPPKPPLTLSPGNTNVDRLANEVLVRGYNVDIGDCLSRSWALLQKNFWLSVGASAVILLIFLGLGSIPGIGYAAVLVLVGPLFGGLYWFFLRLVRGERAELGDVFIGFGSLFVPLLLAGIVQSVLVSLGLLLCIVPGVYLMTIWLFSFFLILDRKMDFWPAMELSRKVVNEQWWPVFGLMLLTCLVFWAGSLLLCVGIFVTAPLATAALAYAYLDIFENPRGITQRPATPRPDSGAGQPAKTAAKTTPSAPSATSRAKAKPAKSAEAQPAKPTPTESDYGVPTPDAATQPTMPSTAEETQPKAKPAKRKAVRKTVADKSAQATAKPKAKKATTGAKPRKTKRTAPKPDSP